MPVIGDYIKVKHGFAFKGDYISTEDNDIVLVTPGNFAIGGGFKEQKCKFFTSEYPDEYVLKEDDLIVTMTDLSKAVDTLGYSALVPFSDKRVYLHNQRIGLVQFLSSEIDKHYLYWYMRTPKYQKNIAATSSGSTVHHTSPDRICEVEIEVPQMEVQRKIARFLDDIEAKININENINRNLSEQVAALYKAWFIDFERNDGVCPEEWETATLGDIAEIGSGKRPPMKQTDKTDDVCIPLVGAASIMGYTNSVLYDSKILVTGRVGTHGVVQRFNNECWPSDNTLVITTDKYEFVNQILLGIDYKSMNRGSTQPLITQGDLKKTEIILPTDAVLDEFEALAGGLMSQYEKNILENTKLSVLRDTLLPKLMSGELDVSDMDF